jgi:hypothetical protein
MVSMAVDQSPEIQNTLALLVTKREMLHRIEATSVRGQADPAYARISAEIARYEKTLEQYRTDAHPRVRDQLHEMAKMQREGEVDMLRNRLDTLQVMEEMLREQYTSQMKTAGSSGGQSLDLEFAKAELSREQKVFELIAERSVAMRTEMRAPGRVTLMQRAASPDAPLETLPWKLMGLAAVASMCLPFGIALLWEQTVRRISDKEQLRKQSDLSVVGEISQLPVRAGRGHRLGGVIDRDLGLFEESVDSLRTALLLSFGDDLQALAVASAISGEGKRRPPFREFEWVDDGTRET